ncbi:uncharacterized protein [Oscarella lobularis]|uniref:uncharacterized protein isoform X2 n=1 Tax=Oscarella lobularis TaxID=121494 RepID=UPI00331366FB
MFLTDTVLFGACFRRHYSIGVLLMTFSTAIGSDSDEETLCFIIEQQQYSSHVSEVVIDLVKMILARSPFIVTLRDQEGRLFHELPCPKNLKNVLVNFWVQYRYRELYAQGTTKPDKIKVCVVGDARAGKTTLIKSLRNVHWEGGDDRRTASVDVTVAKVKSAGELMFCDFAGQPFFHKTHGLFFSASSTAFLFVVNLTIDEEELKRSSHYWASFVKCSVFLVGKAYAVVVGSKKDLLPRSHVGEAEAKLKRLVTYLQTMFGEWFEFVNNGFVLDCRQRSSKELIAFLKTLREVKSLSLKAAKSVPTIVETANKTFLPILRNPSSAGASPSLVQSFTKFLKPTSYRLDRDLRRSIISVMKTNGFVPDSDQESEFACNRSIHADVFKRLMVESICAGLSESIQDLLVEFLQAIGEILVIDDTVVLDFPWLCQNVLGPLMSPRDFPICLDSSTSGTATKESIQKVLESFNHRKWENIDDTISLLCRLEICYPFPKQADTYQFPALIEDQRPAYVWRENSQMIVYVGRRLMSEEATDIITPGTMPFIQSSTRNAPCFRPSEPVVWQDGLLIKRTIGRHSLEGMIVFQDREKAIDFIVRGPEHSEKQCKKHLSDLMNVGMKALQEKSPGTVQSLWYISCTELKQLKDFPVAHKSQTVEETVKISEYSNAKVCQRGIEDTLLDLLALPDDHFTYLPYEALCSVCKFLDKDTKGRSALAERLPDFSSVDRHQCETAKQLLSRWSERLKATTESFVDSARTLGLLYLLMILHDCGSIELSDDEKNVAQVHLSFVEANTPSVIAAMQLTRLASGKRIDSATDDIDVISSSPASAAAAAKHQGKDIANSDYLDGPVTSHERFEAAERIQPIWKQIGRVLGPEPFKHYELHAFGEKANDRERALEMLEAWAMKFGRRATRGQLIDAMMRFDYSTEVAEIFSVSH